MHRLVFLVALALSAAAGPSLAQPVAQAAPHAGEPGTAVRLGLAKRYFAAIHYDQMVQAMTEKMVPALMAEAAKANPNLTSKDRDAIIEATVEAGKAYNHDFGEEAVGLIADTFSEAELTAMVRFYESDVGQSIMSKSQTMIPRMTQMALAHMPALQADIIKRACAKLDCNKVKLPIPKASCPRAARTPGL
jgi:hypothetical protein